MSRNGSGLYSLPTNSWNPAVNGQQALPNDWQALIDDVAAALTASISADGQTPITGVLNFSGNRISNVGAPIGSGDALRWEQMIKGADIASAATISIPVEGNLFDVTGTTTITMINDRFPGRLVYLKFDGEVQLTHSASLILPSGVSAKTNAGDVLVVMNTDSGIWTVVSWPRKTSTGRLLNIQTFTSSGTYTPTPGALFAIVEVQGGGGGGGGVKGISLGAGGAGGGGGGGYSRKRILVSAMGATEAVTVGAGGAGGVGATPTPGGNGGTSSFGSFCSGAGGAGGGAALSTTSATRGGGGADGGGGAGGDINTIGSGGGTGFTIIAAKAVGGAGGASFFGGGGKSITEADGYGPPGGVYGGGGGGACIYDNFFRDGGAGGSGVVIVWEYA